MLRYLAPDLLKERGDVQDDQGIVNQHQQQAAGHDPDDATLAAVDELFNRESFFGGQAKGYHG